MSRVSVTVVIRATVVSVTFHVQSTVHVAMERACVIPALAVTLVCQRRFFTARRYASAVCAVRPSVWSSVTGRYCNKTAKPSITQTTPYDIAGSLVFCCRKGLRNSFGVTPNGGAK